MLAVATDDIDGLHCRYARPPDQPCFATTSDAGTE